MKIVYKAVVPSMAKHQVVLPAKHITVNLLIKSYHNKTQNRTEYILSEMRDILDIESNTNNQENF